MKKNLLFILVIFTFLLSSIANSATLIPAGQPSNPQIAPGQPASSNQLYQVVAANQKIKISGVLQVKDAKTSKSIPVPSGQYQAIISVWDSITGGNKLWEETKPITTDENGIFFVELDQFSGYPNIKFDRPYFVEVTAKLPVSGQLQSITLNPRQEMTWVPYALNSSRLNGKDVSELKTEIKTEINNNLPGSAIDAIVKSPTEPQTIKNYGLVLSTPEKGQSSGTLVATDLIGLQIGTDPFISGMLNMPGNIPSTGLYTRGTKIGLLASSEVGNGIIGISNQGRAASFAIIDPTNQNPVLESLGTGLGPAASFSQLNPSSTSPAIKVLSSANGGAGMFLSNTVMSPSVTIINSSKSGMSLKCISTDKPVTISAAGQAGGMGLQTSAGATITSINNYNYPAGDFIQANPGNTSNALEATNYGLGKGLEVQALSIGIWAESKNGTAIYGINNNGNPTIMLTNKGNGPAGQFTQENNQSNTDALIVSSSGLGSVGNFSRDNIKSPTPALVVETNAEGTSASAGRFKVTNPTSNSPVLEVIQQGMGLGAKIEGTVEIKKYSIRAPILTVSNEGTGIAGEFKNNSSDKATVFVENKNYNGTAAEFIGNILLNGNIKIKNRPYNYKFYNACSVIPLAYANGELSGSIQGVAGKGELLYYNPIFKKNFNTPAYGIIPLNLPNGSTITVIELYFSTTDANFTCELVKSGPPENGKTETVLYSTGRITSLTYNIPSTLSVNKTITIGDNLYLRIIFSNSGSINNYFIGAKVSYSSPLDNISSSQ